MNDEKIELKLFEMPVFKNNLLHLLPVDEYFISNIKFSTITPYDNDILILLKSSFLCFTTTG